MVMKTVLTVLGSLLALNLESYSFAADKRPIEGIIANGTMEKFNWVGQVQYAATSLMKPEVAKQALLFYSAKPEDIIVDDVSLEFIKAQIKNKNITLAVPSKIGGIFFDTIVMNSDDSSAKKWTAELLTINNYTSAINQLRGGEFIASDTALFGKQAPSSGAWIKWPVVGQSR